MKKKITTLKLLVALAISSATLTSQAQTNVFDDIIATSPDHTILEDALITANLDNTLRNATEITVFAPTDAAFTNLLVELGITAGDLLARPDLGEILLYHVLGSEVLSGDLVNGTFATTLQGDSALISLISSGAYIDQAMVALTDVDADNGVVHVLNDVLLPQNSIVDVAITAGFGILTQAVVTAELAPALVDPLVQYTVFAPTDAAFTALASALGTDVNGILALPNLQDILLYHVLGDTISSGNIATGTATALNGETLNISVQTSVMVNDATVTTADVYASNGIIHIIDGVLLPISTSIEEIDNLDILVYPNPAANQLNISLSSDELLDLTLLDLNGKIVLSRTVSDFSNTIDISRIDAGLYFLRIGNNQNYSTTKIQITK